MDKFFYLLTIYFQMFATYLNIITVRLNDMLLFHSKVWHLKYAEMQ